MASPSQMQSFPNSENLYPSIIPVKRSFSGGRMRSNPQQVGEQQQYQSSPNPQCSNPSSTNTLPFPPRTTSRAAAPFNLASKNEQHCEFLLRYSDEDISKGLNLASHPELFRVLRTYSPAYITDGLKYASDGALDFLEAYKGFPLDEVLACKQNIAKFAGDRTSVASIDSTYGSRPSSAVRNSTSSNTLTAIPPSNSSFGPVPGSFIPPSHSSPQTHAGSYYPSPSSTACSPWESTKTIQPQLFACMYCNKGFAKPGNCLNHEKDQHSQKKNWKCGHPGCTAAFPTKRGYDDHHKNHKCPNCPYAIHVEELSKPKTACACPYCGLLFEGDNSFMSRSDHMDEKHYRGEDRKTKADLDYSLMISSLLNRKEIKGAWELLSTDNHGVCMSWIPENAKKLLEELEFGVFHDGITSLLRNLYELADKTTPYGYTSPGDANGTSQPLISYTGSRSHASHDLPGKTTQSATITTAVEASADQGSSCIHPLEQDEMEPMRHDMNKVVFDPLGTLPNSQLRRMLYYDTAVPQGCLNSAACDSPNVPLAARPNHPIPSNHPLHLLQDVFMGSEDERGVKIYTAHPSACSRSGFTEKVVNITLAPVSSPATSLQILQAQTSSSFVTMRDLEKEDDLLSSGLDLSPNITARSLSRGPALKTYHGATIASASQTPSPVTPLPWPPSPRGLNSNQYHKKC